MAGLERVRRYRQLIELQETSRSQWIRISRSNPSVLSGDVMYVAHKDESIAIILIILTKTKHGIGMMPATSLSLFRPQCQHNTEKAKYARILDYRFLVFISLNTQDIEMSSENFVHPSTYRDADGNIAPENREAWMKSMEQMSKDRFVEIEGLEVLRQKVSACFKREGFWLFPAVSLPRREPRG